MVRLPSCVLAIGLVAGLAAPAASQTSLGELARQEEARRGTVKQPARVYTNADLGGEGKAATESQPAPATPAAPAPSTQTPPEAKPAAPPAEPDSKNDEKKWRERITQARDQLARSKMFLDALQSRINALTTDFTARDDPAQRAAISSDRQKALAELERVKRDIDQQTKAIADIQEEARRAGVPPGWVR